MALVKVGYTASIKLVDGGGNVAHFRPGIVGADHATALANCQAVVAALDPMTDAIIGGYSVAEVWGEDTEEYGAVSSEVENIAEVVCRLDAVAAKFHTFRIPAPVLPLFQGTVGPDANDVNIANANLVTFIELFTDKTGYTVPGADAIALISDGEKVKPNNVIDTPVIKAGKRIHRASRKG